MSGITVGWWLLLHRGNKVSKYHGWRRLEELQIQDVGEIVHLGTNKYILLVSSISNLFSTSWHCLLKSRSIVHGYLLSTYRSRCGIRTLSAMVWSQGGADYSQPFSQAQILELWYGVLEALLYLLLTRVIWSSHADLSGPVRVLTS